MTAHNDQAPPQVGIFWLLKGQLILHGVARSEAEPWGRYLNAVGHERYWRQLQLTGMVPGDVEYDEPPRGRVVYDTIAQKYFLYADSCIRCKHELIAEIVQQLGLANQRVEVSGDQHYRCADCLRGSDV